MRGGGPDSVAEHNPAHASSGNAIVRMMKRISPKPHLQQFPCYSSIQHVARRVCPAATGTPAYLYLPGAAGPPRGSNVALAPPKRQGRTVPSWLFLLFI